MVDAVESLFDDVEEKEEIPAPPTVNYWEANLISGQVIVSSPLTVQQASLRVSKGGSIMCANEAAAKHIVFINGYHNAVGPERHGDNYFGHYHPTRNHTGTHSTHIWFYG